MESDRATATPSETLKNEVNIPLHEFEKIVSSGELIIDVREPDEVAAVRVDAKHFLNISVKQFGEALHMDKDTFQQTYNCEKPNPNETLSLICRSGRRSLIAIEIAKENNYTKVRHYNEGTNGWIKHFPDRVVSAAKDV